MADSNTPNLDLILPEEGASEDTWGEKLNLNFGALDALFDSSGRLLAAHSSGGVSPPQGRLTLTSATPVTTSDVTGATTVYYTPYQGACVPIYDGSAFAMRTFSELSQTTGDTSKSPAATAADKNYDVFVWDDGGTLRATRGPAWTNDTTRASSLTMVAGLLLNASSITNGPAASRGTYLGTIRSNGASQIVDSAAFRFVWNAYNRRQRPMRVLETTDSWTTTSTSFMRLNNNSANQLAYVVGLAEDAVRASVVASALVNDSNRFPSVGIGVDSTSTNTALIGQTGGTAGLKSNPTATYDGFALLGYHYLAALQRISLNDGSTYTFYGDNGGDAGIVTGISAAVFA